MLLAPIANNILLICDFTLNCYHVKKDKEFFVTQMEEDGSQVPHIQQKSNLAYIFPAVYQHQAMTVHPNLRLGFVFHTFTIF